jgi:hypothetical protein
MDDQEAEREQRQVAMQAKTAAKSVRGSSSRSPPMTQAPGARIILDLSRPVRQSWPPPSSSDLGEAEGLGDGLGEAAWPGRAGRAAGLLATCFACRDGDAVDCVRGEA